MANKEFEIESKVIGENSKITITVKTMIWIIGLLLTLFSTILSIAYFDVKDDVKSYKEQLKEEKEAFLKKVQDDITEKLEKRRDKEEGFVRDIEEIKGNIRLILDRTQRFEPTPTQGVNKINQNIPLSIPSPNEHN